jgi:predicted HAD superfamily phosphohydrolase
VKPVPKWWLATDCEGPLALNDNAFELCTAYLPAGERIFRVLSRYDDYLVEVERRAGHPAGSTLRWVAPFLRAFGLTEARARDFAARTLLFLPEVPPVLRAVKDLLPAFVISTSYRPYIEALCDRVGLPADCTFSTPFPLDAHSLAPGEAERLAALAADLAGLSPPEWPEGAAGPEDLEPEHRATIRVLARAVAELEGLSLAPLLRAVAVVGGPAKARALREAAQRLSALVGEALYLGDSITDAEALSLVRTAGGVAVAFNGNRYALAAAEIAVLSPHAGPILALAAVHARGGPQAVRDLVASWPEAARDRNFAPGWKPEYARAEMLFVEEQDFETLVARSEAVRRRVRGEAVGSLG